MKKKSALTIFVIIAILAFNSCGGNKAKEPVALMNTQIEQQIPVGDNSQTSLDWNGIYEGTLPCADCEGIYTIIELNLDKSFVMSNEYLGKKDNSKRETKGSFEWDNTGSNITLIDAGNVTKHFKVGENRLFALDQDGQMITGELANLYILIKK